ncbi:uncharacterized protein [Spinacia oleracea]|uniref:Reverse transcriptase zinc-binding domain-containing protein n=1 Tax=Spinacia oleracea TaxID=3562 RepID=A0ABM3R6W3_SPIOL|nr:uncharacterized protein LOC130466777 [Spinacia oleracea]
MVCRSFLWSGQAYSSKPSNISWKSSCCEKKEGGLGFRDILTWNTAAIGKYVWAVATKQDSIWIKWVSSVYVKDGEWWEYQPNNSASWYWRKICETKEVLKQYYTIAEFSSMSCYSVKDVYQKLTGPKPLVHWDHMVWNRLNTPKHKFICWMAVQDRLQTAARLARIGVCSSPNCLLCDQQEEVHDHLFFACPYSKRCIEEIKSWVGFHTTHSGLQILISRIGNSHQTKFRRQVWYAALAATVYSVWRSRNGSLWDKCIPTVHSTVTRIKQIVRDRIRSVMPRKVSRKDSLWFLTL